MSNILYVFLLYVTDLLKCHQFLTDKKRLSFTFIVKKNILWLQVSVDDFLLMKVLQSLNDLSCIITCPRLIKAWIILVYIINVVPENKGGKNLILHIIYEHLKGILATQ